MDTVNKAIQLRKCLRSVKCDVNILFTKNILPHKQFGHMKITLESALLLANDLARKRKRPEFTSLLKDDTEKLCAIANKLYVHINKDKPAYHCLCRVRRQLSVGRHLASLLHNEGVKKEPSQDLQENKSPVSCLNNTSSTIQPMCAHSFGFTPCTVPQCSSKHPNSDAKVSTKCHWKPSLGCKFFLKSPSLVFNGMTADLFHNLTASLAKDCEQSSVSTDIDNDCKVRSNHLTCKELPYALPSLASEQSQSALNIDTSIGICEAVSNPFATAFSYANIDYQSNTSFAFLAHRNTSQIQPERSLPNSSPLSSNKYTPTQSGSTVTSEHWKPSLNRSFFLKRPTLVFNGLTAEQKQNFANVLVADQKHPNVNGQAKHSEVKGIDVDFDNICQDISHVLQPLVTEPSQPTAALNTWSREMSLQLANKVRRNIAQVICQVRKLSSKEVRPRLSDFKTSLNHTFSFVKDVLRNHMTTEFTEALRDDLELIASSAQKLYVLKCKTVMSTNHILRRAKCVLKATASMTALLHSQVEALETNSLFNTQQLSKKSLTFCPPRFLDLALTTNNVFQPIDQSKPITATPLSNDDLSHGLSSPYSLSDTSCSMISCRTAESPKLLLNETFSTSSYAPDDGRVCIGMNSVQDKRGRDEEKPMSLVVRIAFKDFMNGKALTSLGQNIKSMNSCTLPLETSDNNPKSDYWKPTLNKIFFLKTPTLNYREMAEDDKQRLYNLLSSAQNSQSRQTTTKEDSPLSVAEKHKEMHKDTVKPQVENSETLSRKSVLKTDDVIDFELIKKQSCLPRKDKIKKTVRFKLPKSRPAQVLQMKQMKRSLPRKGSELMDAVAKMKNDEVKSKLKTLKDKVTNKSLVEDSLKDTYTLKDEKVVKAMESSSSHKDSKSSRKILTPVRRLTAKNIPTVSPDEIYINAEFISEEGGLLIGAEVDVWSPSDDSDVALDNILRITLGKRSSKREQYYSPTKRRRT